MRDLANVSGLAELPWLMLLFASRATGAAADCVDAAWSKREGD